MAWSYNPIFARFSEIGLVPALRRHTSPRVGYVSNFFGFWAFLQKIKNRNSPKRQKQRFSIASSIRPIFGKNGLIKRQIGPF
jgi:hypothetical protein